MHLVIALIVGYISIVVSDYLVHRNIMHGKWKIVRVNSRFFRMVLYPHFVQHLLVHHSHSILAKADLLEGLPVPISLKIKKEERFKHQHWSHKGLLCSNHGMGIVDSFCLFSFISLFLLTPHYFVTLLAGFYLGYDAAILIFALTFLPALNHSLHRFYHMDIDGRAKHVPRYIRWFFQSIEVQKISEEHMEHHHNKDRNDDYYNLLPFGRYILRPIFGRH